MSPLCFFYEKFHPIIECSPSLPGVCKPFPVHVSTHTTPTGFNRDVGGDAPSLNPLKVDLVRPLIDLFRSRRNDSTHLVPENIQGGGGYLGSQHIEQGLPLRRALGHRGGEADHLGAKREVVGHQRSPVRFTPVPTYSLFTEAPRPA